MKQTIHLLGLLVLLLACKNDKQSDTAHAYTDCPLTYLIDGELYFHDFIRDEKLKFTEETEPILNFVFDEEGKTLYYSVERNGTLWLKAANISNPEVAPEWLISWSLDIEKDMGFSFVGMSPLYYHEGNIIVMHGYNLDSFYYDLMTHYYINKKETTQMDMDIGFIRSTYGMLSWEESYKHFKQNDNQLYYIPNSKSVCLTNKIDFKAIEEKNRDNFEIANTRSYSYYIFSPDRSKVAFGVGMLEGSEWVVGPFCLANVDGSKQMALLESNFTVVSNPIWLNNNEFAFRSFEGKLYIANNNEKSIEMIAEGVFDFKTRIRRRYSQLLFLFEKQKRCK